MPERIVGPGGTLAGNGSPLAACSLRTDSGGYRWVLLLADDMRQTERRTPIHLADAHRIRDDGLLLAALRLGIIVEPMLGQIDDDPLVRTRRQNMPSGDDHLLARPGTQASIPGLPG